VPFQVGTEPLATDPSLKTTVPLALGKVIVRVAVGAVLVNIVL